MDVMSIKVVVFIVSLIVSLALFANVAKKESKMAYVFGVLLLTVIFGGGFEVFFGFSPEGDNILKYAFRQQY